MTTDEQARRLGTALMQVRALDFESTEDFAIRLGRLALQHCDEAIAAERQGAMVLLAATIRGNCINGKATIRRWAIEPIMLRPQDFEVSRNEEPWGDIILQVIDKAAPR